MNGEEEEESEGVKCTIKAPVFLQIGEMKSDLSRSGVCVLDVSLPFGQPVNSDLSRSGVCVLDVSLPFGQPVNIETISFQNHYTAFLTIETISFQNHYTAFLTVRLLIKASEHDSARWRTAVRNMTLMENPHTETGAQDYTCIHRTQMQILPENVQCVRLILRQPSSAWIKFTLEHITIHPHREQDTEKEVSDWLSDLTLVDQQPDLEEVSDWLSDLTLVDQQPDLEGLPDPQTVSSSLQQMWALTEVMQSNQTTATIGRFDVDGCYDINLLSLT